MNEPISIVGLGITSLAILSILISFIYSRQGSPLLAMINRWLRWILFSLAIAYIFRESEWSTRPFWALASMAFLVIQALSRSEMPLFPKFRENSKRDDWPAQPRYIKIRDWLRKEGFKRVASLKAELLESVEIRSTVYESEDRTIRIQVVFVPQRNSSLSACFVVSSMTGENERVITDNIFIPFGGFYPEGWDLCRRPLVRKISHLVALHKKRLSRHGGEPQPWDPDLNPRDELNEQQRILEKTNLERGFLLPRNMQEEHGKITQAGRYRIWKEIWCMNYLGLPMRYR